jgi:hypothetical protein
MTSGSLRDAPALVPVEPPETVDSLMGEISHD